MAEATKSATQVIAVAAGSAMGKTVLAEMLKEEMEKLGKTVEIVSEDWFYKAPTNPKAVKVVYPIADAGDESSAGFKLMHADDEGVKRMASEHGVAFEEMKVVQNITKGLHDWSHPGALDMDGFSDVVEGIKAGKKMSFNEFSFSTKLQDGPEHSIEAPDVLIVEGVFALTGMDIGGPRYLSHDTVDHKVSIGMKDYYNKGLARALERNLERRKAGTLEERKAAIKAQWDKAHGEYVKYIQPYIGKKHNTLVVRNDTTLEDFHNNIHDLADKLLGRTRLRKPKWKQVKDVHPDGKGLNLMLKVVKKEKDPSVHANNVTWEVVAGDATGVVSLRLIDEAHAKACEPGASIRVQNARVLMREGHIRVIIDKWGVLKAADSPMEVDANAGNDISATEYELK